MERNKFIDRCPMWVRRKWYEYKAVHNYDNAVEKAEKTREKLGNERVFVMVAPDCDLLLMTKDGFKDMRRRGYVNKGINMNDVWKSCVYYTSAQFGRDPIENSVRDERRKAYIELVVEDMCKSRA